VGPVLDEINRKFEAEQKCADQDDHDCCRGDHVTLPLVDHKSAGMNATRNQYFTRSVRLSTFLHHPLGPPNC
jgi:hypothetical protein